MRVVGFIAHFCGAIAHLFAIILTGVLRFNDDGKLCAERELLYDDSDENNTFSWDAS